MPLITQRRSIRLPDYDYSAPGTYFVTLCTHNRLCLFGAISDERMTVNSLGLIVHDEWSMSASIRKEIQLGEFVLMPNHLHAIVTITCRGDRLVAPASSAPRLQPRSLGSLIAGFKAAATRRINALRNTPTAQVWQRNYYEHVIRNEDDYRQIAEYVADNPRRWAEDALHPDRPPRRGDR